MKKLYLLTLMCLAAAITLKAQSKQTYAVVENGVLTYYYDTKRSTHTTSFTVPISSATITYNDFWAQIAKLATKIVIDPSFKDYHPNTALNLFHRYDESYNSYGVLSNVTEIEGIENLNTAEMTDMSSLFFGMKSIKTLDIRSLNMNNVERARSVFEKCESLTTIYCNEDWSKLTKIQSIYGTGVFEGCTALVGGKGTKYSKGNNSIEYAHPDGGTSSPGYFTQKITIPLLYTKYDASTHVLTYYYDGRYNRIDPMITIMEEECQQKFLNYAADIRKIVVDPSVATSQPINLAGIFSTCRTDKPMSSMTEIEGLEYIDGTRLTNISFLFDGCTALKSVDLTHLNTNKVTDMGAMFYNCKSLQSVNLMNFDMTNVGTVSGMFTNCSSLKTIYCKTDWTVIGMDADDLFENCTSLVGGKGTVYDENHTYLDYARPDGGAASPGYFTATTPQGIESVQQSTGNTQKVIRDGQLCIIRGNKTFNALGAEVK